MPTSVKKNATRANREDGDATKAKIIAAAGPLFAEHGYANTTSKEICRCAKVGQALVNYHFGSRAGLYLAVLREMNEFFTKPEELRKLGRSAGPPREKLLRIMRHLMIMLAEHDKWQVRLWAREVLAPSSLAIRKVYDAGPPGIGAFMKIIGECTGLPEGDPKLHLCFISTISPFIILLLKRQGSISPYREVFELPHEEMLEDLRKFVFAGLDAFVVKTELGERRA